MNFTKFLIEYNYSYGQDNYVLYVSTSGGNNDTRRCSWTKSANYTTKDYTGTFFQRGHLVPYADYGPCTCTLYNAVPMYPKFNDGIWKKYEDYVRKHYAGNLIIKGCKYNPSIFITTPTHKILYVPLGCYFIVTDLKELVSDKKFGIVDYGYLINSLLSNDITLYKELPWWILAA
jgi:DNA/RNA endonuclease G (NUC1)